MDLRDESRDSPAADPSSRLGMRWASLGRRASYLHSYTPWLRSHRRDALGVERGLAPWVHGGRADS